MIDSLKKHSCERFAQNKNAHRQKEVLLFLNLECSSTKKLPCGNISRFAVRHKHRNGTAEK